MDKILILSYLCNQGGPEIGGIFVKTLLPDGAAEQSGSILVGMMT